MGNFYAYDVTYIDVSRSAYTDKSDTTRLRKWSMTFTDENRDYLDLALVRENIEGWTIQEVMIVSLSNESEYDITILVGDEAKMWGANLFIAFSQRMANDRPDMIDMMQEEARDAAEKDSKTINDHIARYKEGLSK